MEGGGVRKEERDEQTTENFNHDEWFDKTKEKGFEGLSTTQSTHWGRKTIPTVWQAYSSVSKIIFESPRKMIHRIRNIVKNEELKLKAGSLVTDPQAWYTQKAILKSLDFSNIQTTQVCLGKT